MFFAKFKNITSKIQNHVKNISSIGKKMTVVDLLLSDEFLPSADLDDWLKTGRDGNVRQQNSSF